MAAKKDHTTFVINLPKDLYDALRRQAFEANKPMSALVIPCLQDCLGLPKQQQHGTTERREGDAGS
jgi:hypothetical protein